jgi:hypothetical protein
VKQLLLILIAILTPVITACNKQPESKTENQNQKQAETQTQPTQRSLTAKDYIEAFQKSGIPIGSTVYYTAENDPNNLLGRPNQYIEKASWEDKRIKQQPDYNPAHKGSSIDLAPEGGTIEIFASRENLEARKQYVEAVTSKMSPLAQYSYVHGNALIRLEKELTPSQAAEYEKALKELD